MQSPVLEFDKSCTQNAYFLQKVDFCIFEPQNREVIENSSKTPLNFSQLQCTYLGENSFQYHLGLVSKKEIEKWLLRTSVQCIIQKVIISAPKIKLDIHGNRKSNAKSLNNKTNNELIYEDGSI